MPVSKDATPPGAEYAQAHTGGVAARAGPGSRYSEGKLTDVGRGPHGPSNGKLKVFQLSKLAGA